MCLFLMLRYWCLIPWESRFRPNLHRVQRFAKQRENSNDTELTFQGQENLKVCVIEVGFKSDRQKSNKQNQH